MTDAQSYATMAFLLFLPGGVVQFSLAGHLPVLHWRHKDGTVEQHAVDNFPIAMFPKSRFSIGELHPEPGDLLALITDGLTEIFNERGDESGTAYIEQSLRDLAGRSLVEIASRILEESRRFGAITDDQTLLLVRLNRSPAPAVEV